MEEFTELSFHPQGHASTSAHSGCAGGSRPFCGTSSSGFCSTSWPPFYARQLRCLHKYLCCNGIELHAIRLHHASNRSNTYLDTSHQYVNPVLHCLCFPCP